MTYPLERIDAVSALAAEHPDYVRVGDVFAALDRAITLAERYALKDTHMLASAARSRVLSELLERLY